MAWYSTSAVKPSSKTLLGVLVLAIGLGGWLFVRVRGGAAGSAPAAPAASGPPAATSPSPGAPPAAADPGAPAPAGAPPAAGKDDFAPLFAARLAIYANRFGQVATAEGDKVTFEHEAILLDTRVEHDRPADGKQGIGVAVGVNMPDGAEPYYVVSGAIGVGNTRAEAIDQAVSGWLGLTGKAVLEAVPRRATSEAAMPMGAFTVYPGNVAVRGPVDLHWTPREEKQLLEALAPALSALDPRVSHSAAISMVILGGGAIDGQCLIDNLAADKLCEAAKKFGWVGSPEGYLVRQVYLIRPRLAPSR